MKGLKGKTLCVYSPKGGTGKTYLAASLGATASNLNKKVLLVDFDFYNGSLSMFINTEITKTIFNLADDFNNNRYNSLSDYIYKYNDNIDILCAPKDPRQGTKINSEYIEIILERAANQYDLVIIDTYSNLDENMVTLLDVSDTILFVINNDLFTIKNIKNILTIFNDNNITNYKILMNYSVDPKIPYFTHAEIKRLIGANINYTISKDFFMKELSSYIYDSIIPLSKENILRRFKTDTKNLEIVVRDVLGGQNEEK